MFKKVLIANRGEIALRVMWACKELGVKTVAVYSEADAHSLHVRFADEAVCIGPPRNIESYLNIPAIISAAEITGAEAIHPGYGFLSESSYLAEICEACNIKFIGPGPQAIRLMGDKSRARKAMMKAGVPVVPGSPGVLEDEEKAVRAAKDVGFPVILKASAGGGGRGMRIVRAPADLAQAFRAAQAEAAAAFGVPDVYVEKYVEGPRHVEIQVMADSKGSVVHLGERECSIQRRHQKIIEEAPSPVVNEKLRRRMGRTAVEAAAAVRVPDVYVEKYVEGPRHVEIQVMADSKGSVVHLGERECSIQRRHQKIIEEAPSPVVNEKLRRRMGRTAVEAAAAVQYVNAGTVEFLVDKDGSFYFMEMNTRIQVEHGVTELVTGRDLVKEQILVAAGEPLSFAQKDVTFNGHALECRINAEDPVTFVPSPGTIRHFNAPGGPGVRIDTFAHEGCEISPYYDSMIGKLMTHGRDRKEAIARMRRSLEVMVVEGIKTNIPLHLRIMDDPDFQAGRLDTRFMDRFMPSKKAAPAAS
ncbi:MAG: acetyl-CoA carboxylase biotin carboxylase subunit [Acidobacteria bacterium]|nr:MAG: acetyl-CoA carboxylase biotin carboxylase subunit [Acidobacteriota bacterium]